MEMSLVINVGRYSLPRTSARGPFLWRDRPPARPGTASSYVDESGGGRSSRAGAAGYKRRDACCRRRSTKRVQFAPFNEGGTRGYQFFGNGSYGGVLLGDTCLTAKVAYHLRAANYLARPRVSG